MASVSDSISTIAQPRLGTAVFAIFLGSALEIFDFTLFSFFAPTIGRLFFPTGSQSAALLLGVATFGIGFLARVPGGIVLGRLADRRGRTVAMSLAFALMAAGTAVVGLTPSHAVLGIYAPLLLVAGRLLQGFSAGGEIGPSTAWLAEAAPAHSRNLVVSWQIASQGAAMLAAALCGLVLTRGLSPAALETWGWRLPFLSGLLIGPVGMMIRRTLPETSEPRGLGGHGDFGAGAQARMPWGTLLICIGVIAGSTATTHLVVLYMPTYLTHLVHLPGTTAFLSTCAAAATIFIATPLIAALADRFGWPQRLLLMVTMLVVACGAYPAFSVLADAPGLGVVLIVTTLLSIGLAAMASVGLTVLCRQFPHALRGVGVGTAYNVAVCVFGGFSQFVVTWLIGASHNLAAPAWYLIGCSAVSLIALTRLPSP